MKKRSLQAIQDFYENKGYKGEALRRVLEKDKEYLSIIKERNKRLSKKFSISAKERQKYVLSTDEDYEILAKIEKLEKMELTKEEKFLLKLLKSQLEHDWRRPLIKFLDKMLKKYEG